MRLIPRLPAVLRATLTSTILAATLAAGEVPLAEITLADGATIDRHWRASPYGRLWADPALAGPRKVVQAEIRALASSISFDPCAAISDSTGIRLLVGDFARLTDAVQPVASARLELGALSAATVPVLQARIAPVMPGTFSATIAPDGKRVDLTWGTGVDATAFDLPTRTVKADLSLAIDVRRLLDRLIANVPGAATGSIAKVRTLWGDTAGDASLTIDLVPEGIRERWRSPKGPAMPGFATITLEPGRIPKDAIFVAVIGVDGNAAWPAWSGLIWQLAALADAEPSRAVTPAEAEQSFNAYLTRIGIRASLGDLVSGLNGTIMLTVHPGMPFPIFTLAVPTAPSLDRVVEAWLQSRNLTTPAPGKSIPVTFGRNPLPFFLLRDQQHWVLSNDEKATGHWQTASTEKRPQNPLFQAIQAKAPSDAWAIIGLDTPALLRLAQPFLPMMVQTQDPADRDALVQAWPKLIDLAHGDWMVIGREKGQTTYEAQGPAGGICTKLLLTGLAALGVSSGRPAPMPVQQSSANATGVDL